MRWVAAGMTALALTAFVRPVAAETCRIALTLALDVSSSVDAREYGLQIYGLAAALEDEVVRSALFLTPGAYVALQAFEWSGERHQTLIQDWVLIRSPADLDAMSTALRAHQRTGPAGQTALGEALGFAFRQLERAPACAARKIDISGDGQSNVGIKPQDVYWHTKFDAVIVNGLAIEASVAGLSDYFRNFVVHGTGAFVIRIATYDDYAQAIRNKLVRELTFEQIVLYAPGGVQDGLE